MLHWKGGVKVNNKDLRSNRIRYAIDECLSGVDKLPTLQYKVLQKTRGDVKVRKKLSAGLCLTIILVLAAMGAVAAALLSARDIVEKQAIPMASQSAGDTYSVEETRELLVLAEENGITLSDEAKESISRYLKHDKGYYKEEMIMALAKAEFGDDPTTWSLEEQKWFDDVCVAIGFISESEKSIPEGGEEAKYTMIQASSDYIRKTYDIGAPLDDPSKYKIGTQYLNGDVNGEYSGMYWAIDYSPLYLEGAEYWVYMREDGTVLSDTKRPGLEKTSTVDDVLSTYCNVFGSEHNWDQSILRAFKESAMKTTDTNSRAYLCLMKTHYPDIPVNAINKEQAHILAAKYVGFETHANGHVFLIDDKPHPVYKVMVVQNGVSWSVEIDCVTGEIKSSRLLDGQHKKWWMRMVLWEVSDNVDKIWVDNSLSAG